jgi:outer membrane protein, heavy metal efflux system
MGVPSAQDRLPNRRLGGKESPDHRPSSELLAARLLPASREQEDKQTDVLRLASVALQSDAEPILPPQPEEEPGTEPTEDDDPEVPSAPSSHSHALTLDQVINTTLMQDPVLRAGFEAIRQANADHLTSTLKPNPELIVEQTLLPLTRPFIADTREGGPPQLDVMLEYPIDWFLFGKRAAAMQSAVRDVQASRAEYADLIRQRVLEAAIAFYDVLEAQALVELAEQDVENFLQVEEIARIGVENQGLPRVELSRIRLDRLSSQQSLRDAQRDLTAARAALLEVMGLQDSERMYEVVGVLEAPLRQEPLSLEEALPLAESHRPDIQGLRWRIAEASANVDVEYREAFPEVTPMIGYTRQFQRRAIGQPHANSWGIGVTMGLPFYDRNQGNRARAASELHQAGHELRGALVELNAEITAIIAELETARINAIATAEEQLELAEEVRDSITQAYELGARPLIDVLDSQRNFRETYRNYIESRAAYWRAVHQFNATMGTPVLR